VTLATLACHVPHHSVLAVMLAAVFCRLDSSSAFLKAGYARPREKRQESQDDNPHSPEMMLLAALHVSEEIALPRLRIPSNPGSPWRRLQ
jgi:hypothetical protein